MHQLRINLRGVTYQDGDLWFAHLLDMGVLGHGPTKADALNSLADAISTQVEASIEIGNLENLVQPADREYFTMYAMADGQDTIEGELVLELVRKKLEGRRDADQVVFEPGAFREFHGGTLAACGANA